MNSHYPICCIKNNSGRECVATSVKFPNKSIQLPKWMTSPFKRALDQANQTNSISKCSLGVNNSVPAWHSPHPSILHAPLFVQGWGKWDKLTSHVHISSLSGATGKAIHLKISAKKYLKSHDQPLATNHRGNSLRTTEEFLRALLVKGVKGQCGNVWPSIYPCPSLCKTCLSSRLLLSTAAE